MNTLTPDLVERHREIEQQREQRTTKCANQISDPALRERFRKMLRDGDQLSNQAAALRREAWADFRRITGKRKRS